MDPEAFCDFRCRNTIVWLSTLPLSCHYTRWATVRRRGYHRTKGCSRWTRLCPLWRRSFIPILKPKTTAVLLFMMVSAIPFSNQPHSRSVTNIIACYLLSFIPSLIFLKSGFLCKPPFPYCTVVNQRTVIFMYNWFSFIFWQIKIFVMVSSAWWSY